MKALDFIAILLSCGSIFLLSGGNTMAQEDQATSENPGNDIILEELTEADFMPRKPVTHKEFTEMAEEVVAKVGDKAIKKKNVWEVFHISPEIKTIPPFNRKLLDRAIENELIYQEGLRREIDKTEEFQARLKGERKAQWKRSVPELAKFMEITKLREIGQLIKPFAPAPEEVEDLFVECRHSFPEGMSDEAIKNNIRDLLASQGPMLAYQKWLSGLFRNSVIKINGKLLALDKIARSLQDFSLAQGLKGIKAGEKESQMFLEIVESKIPEDESMLDIRMAISGDAIVLKEEAKLKEALDEDKSLDFTLLLFSLAKNYLLAQEARKEGLTLPEKGEAWETPLEKIVIISLLLQKLVEEEPEVEITKEEIVSFYRSHPRYHGMTMEGIKKRMYERMKSEKHRQAAIDRLKERFKVEILID
jgi:hypothetical protein